MKEKDDKKMVAGYKGFDLDWECLGYQFEPGKTFNHSGSLELCKSGFHFCENPLDVLRYYSPVKSQFAAVEAEGTSPETSEDTKRVCSSIKIKAQVNLAEMIKAGVELIIQSVKNKIAGVEKKESTSGDNSPSATSGYYSPSATSGFYSPSATSGYCSPSATSGSYSHSATSGDYSPSATSGDNSPSATSGDYSPSATSGYCSHSATSGSYSHSATSGSYSHSATSGDNSHSATSGYYSPSATSGDNSIAAAIGKKARAKSALGNWIVVSEISDDGVVLCVKTAKVDGVALKADTFYKVVGGEFMEIK